MLMMHSSTLRKKIIFSFSETKVLIFPAELHNFTIDLGSLEIILKSLEVIRRSQRKNVLT